MFTETPDLRTPSGSADRLSARVDLLGGARLLGVSPVGDALAASVCTLTPEQEEGPFSVALERIRSNITSRRTGVLPGRLITV